MLKINTLRITKIKTKCFSLFHKIPFDEAQNQYTKHVLCFFFVFGNIQNFWSDFRLGAGPPFFSLSSSGFGFLLLVRVALLVRGCGWALLRGRGLAFFPEPGGLGWFSFVGVWPSSNG